MKNVKKIEIKLEKEWVESLDAVFKKKNKYAASILYRPDEGREQRR